MGIFSKPEQIVMKNSDRDEKYLGQLNDLLNQTNDSELKKKIEKEIAIVSAGIVGEKNVLYELQNSGIDMIILHDFFIETDEGHSAQIDFMVICSRLVFIIECKNLFGNIEINNKGDFIRTIQYGGKYYKEGIYSPITQNARHLEVMKEKKNSNHGALFNVLSNALYPGFYKSLIVLANPKTVLNDKYAKKEIKQQVFRSDQLIQVIKSENSKSNMPSFSFKKMKELGEGWLSNCSEHPDNRIDKFREMFPNDEQNNSNKMQMDTNISNPEQQNKGAKLKHSLGSLNSRASCIENCENLSSESETKLCPRCGKPMVKRIAKRGDNKGNAFWGCTGYPHCRYIEQI